MIPIHVAIVDETKTLDPAQLQQLAGALNEQVNADFAPQWTVKASVGYYTVPPDPCWQVQIVEHLDQKGALGYHTDANRQPVSYVSLTEGWQVTVSHETLEMLADPFGNRLTTATLPDAVAERYAEFGLATPTDRIHYLLEVCDPCEATSYAVSGIKLSDFLLPGWYRTAPGPHVATSHASGTIEPRQVADGGYVSFSNDAKEWFQIFNQGGQYQISDLGKFDTAQFDSLRQFSDASARSYRAAASS